MKIRAILLVSITIIILMISCQDKTLQLPIKTSYGDLIRVSKSKSLKTDDKALISAGKDTLIYILTFRGDSLYKNTFPGNYWDTLYGFNKIVLADAEGKTLLASNVGSLDDQGVLSLKDWQTSIKSDVNTIVSADRFTQEVMTTAEVHIPGSQFSLAYFIPKKTKGLCLPDSAVKHPIY